MPWTQYLACFFAGAFLANFFPHYVQGVCGNKFPTPFAKPPGKGLSSATVNVAWALLNLVAGFFLFRGGQVALGDSGRLIFFFAGAAILSLQMSRHFVSKHAE